MVYYVEDDTNIRELTIYALKQAGIEAEGFSDDAEFRVACAKRVPEAVLLDIMLPDTDGLQILRRIRRTPGLENVPVMMLTAKDTELDTVRALDNGADDYLAKPFGMMELLSRIRALLRRTEREEPAWRIGCLSVDPGCHAVMVEGQEVALTQKEFEVLCLLLRCAGQVVSRDRLIEEVWGYAFTGETRTVDVHIRTLRQKLGPAGQYVETVRGYGYKVSREG